MENIALDWKPFCDFCDQEGIADDVAREFWATYWERNSFGYWASMPHNWEELLIRKNEACV